MLYSYFMRCILILSLLFLSSVAHGRSNIEPELCFISLKNAYEHAEKSGVSYLKYPEICGKYKASFDRNYRADAAFTFEGEAAIDARESEFVDRAYQDFVRARDQCLSHLELLKSFPGCARYRNGCLEFDEKSEHFNLIASGYDEGTAIK